MAKKDKKAAEEKAVKKAKKVMTPEEKAAKKAARMEALKNRPAEQRPNSKQIDVINLGEGNVIKNFGYPIKKKNVHVGVLITSVALKNGEVVSTSTSFVPGDLTVKCKKGHGVICGSKHKGNFDAEDAEDTEEVGDDAED